MFDLSGKRALVTGSTQGIGKAVANILASHGATVVIHGSTSLEKCKRAAMDICGTTEVALADLSDERCAEILFEQTGNVDILVLNASVQIRKEWNQISGEEFDYQIATNLKASLSLMQKYVPYMQSKKWGRVVTVGSVQQYRPNKVMAVYAAGKSAQMALIQNLAKQVAQDGVTINNLCPGVILTPRNDEALSDKEYAKQIMDGIPVGYAGIPEDCAAAALLLCSEEGRYITGSEIIIDGGMHL